MKPFGRAVQYSSQLTFLFNKRQSEGSISVGAVSYGLARHSLGDGWIHQVRQNSGKGVRDGVGGSLDLKMAQQLP